MLKLRLAFAETKKSIRPRRMDYVFDVGYTGFECRRSGRHPDPRPFGRGVGTSDHLETLLGGEEE